MYELKGLLAWPHFKESVIIIDDVRLFLGYEKECHGMPECYPSLEDLRDVVCALSPDSVFEVVAGQARIYKAGKRVYPIPPSEIPPDLYSEFTEGGTLPVIYGYSNMATAVVPGKPVPEPKVVTYGLKEVDDFIAAARKKEAQYYGEVDGFLFKLLERHPDALQGKSVVVMGSLVPWYESVAIANGAKSVLTVEYGPRVSEHPQLSVIMPDQLKKSGSTFDVAISISSFEHDGLGRYGDPLQGRGDILTMAAMKSVVKPGGLLFLAVPRGKDAIVFNLHRIYGPVRWPLLIAGWKVLDSDGVGEGLEEQALGSFRQPVYMLRAL